MNATNVCLKGQITYFQNETKSAFLEICADKFSEKITKTFKVSDNISYTFKVSDM